MSTELKDTLEECINELNGLYSKYEKMNQSEARQFSRAIQKCEYLLKNYSAPSSDNQTLSQPSATEDKWQGDNRRIPDHDRRKPGDRRRISSGSRRR